MASRRHFYVAGVGQAIYQESSDYKVNHVRFVPRDELILQSLENNFQHHVHVIAKGFFLLLLTPGHDLLPVLVIR